jgi:hypothetical protein
MAESLHGKRMAAGEQEKSAIALGLTPQWPKLPEAAADIRLYIVAHGVDTQEHASTDRVQIFCGGQAFHPARNFLPCLKSFVQKAPQQKVKRISLVMCNSAGMRVGSREEVSVQDSFARQLADLCGELTIDVVGRQGAVDVARLAYEKAEIDRQFLPDKNTLPLHTFAKEGKGQYSLLNAKKIVCFGAKEYHRFLTYVFEPNKPPQLKPGYHDNLTTE